MIQRIQSVYLLIVAILLVCCLFMPLGYFLMPDAATQMFFKPFGVELSEGVRYSTWALSALLLIGSLVSLITIFLFKNRPLQIRLSIFNSILLIGYYAALVFFVFRLQSDLGAEFFMNWAICLPAIAFILLFLAIRGIGKDEVLVRASDRIR